MNGLVKAAGCAVALLALGCVASTPELPNATRSSTEPPGRGVIEGRVLHPNGDPASSVLVRLSPGRRNDTARGVEHRAVTGADGAFRLEVPAGSYMLHARLTEAPDHALLPAYPLSVHVTKYAVLRHEIRLQHGHTIRGHVVGPEGEAIPGAFVEVTATLRSPGRLAHTFRVFAVARADGSFELRGLPAGVHTLTISFDGVEELRKQYLPATRQVEAGTKDFRFVLSRAGRILGVVTDGTLKAPLTGARVDVFGGPVITNGGSALTHDQGEYEVTGLAAGTYTVRVTARDRERVFERVWLESGQALRLDTTLTEDDEIPPDRSRIRRRAEAGAPPYWYALGGPLYFAHTREDAQRSILSFDAEPHWFPGYGEGPDSRPRAIDLVETNPHGASLAVSVNPHEVDPRLLRLSLTLTAGDEALVREVEHRHTNVLPFLFALRADGRSVTSRVERSMWGRIGGAPRFADLVGANAQRHWDLVVTASSLERLLPDPLPEEIELAVVFGERQHDRPGFLLQDDPSFWNRRQGPSRAQAAESGPPELPDALVASPVVKLRRVGRTWLPAE